MKRETWSDVVRLSELPVRRRLAPDEATRAAIAATLELDALPQLTAEIEATPWLDGARVDGRWQAVVTQTCGVTLEPFDSALSGDFSIRAVPADSPNAPAEPKGEIDLELVTEDPPDLLPALEIDLGGYVVEHLALEIDPYPRKPDAVFEPPQAERESSPFDVLARLKQPD